MTERIAVLCEHPESCDALAPEFQLMRRLGSPGDDTFVDALVVDAPSLVANEATIRLLREESAPASVPLLLLADRTTIAALPAALWDTIDDVALRPLDDTELFARVRGLLRARGVNAPAVRAAKRFQKAALPHSLPRVPGFAFDAYYRAGSDAASLGGDWYDAFTLADGSVLVSVGDVSGTGVDAAIVMASVRHVFRGVAQINPDPRLVLEAADRALRAENPESFVTAFVGIVDPITAQITYASAGHPRPFLRKADGSVTELAAFGFPLGLPFDDRRHVETMELPLDSVLVLYTDGLVEGERDAIAGEATLRFALGTVVPASVENVAVAVHDAVLGGPSRDDVAVLTVRHVPRDRATETVIRWSFDARDADAARAVRAEFVAALAAARFAPDALANAELVFAELVSNVVRYAPRWVDIALDVSGALPVLHVLDGGPGFRHQPKLPAGVLSETGRGLFIVSRLTEEFHVTKRPRGGSHARAVLSSLRA
jgi:anti-sigma regulatory factor (Ser/Thr protein kinase)